MPLVVLVLLSGCVLGGGPVLGVRLDHPGYVYGGEVSAGVVVAQTSLGIDSVSPHGYLRLDATWDAAGEDSSYTGTWNTFGGRLGAGYRFRDEGGRMFVIGPSVSSIDRALSWHSGCAATLTGSGVGVFVFYLDLRYADGWQLVLNPRLEGHGDNFLGCT